MMNKMRYSSPTRLIEEFPWVREYWDEQANPDFNLDRISISNPKGLHWICRKHHFSTKASPQKICKYKYICPECHKEQVGLLVDVKPEIIDYCNDAGPLTDVLTDSTNPIKLYCKIHGYDFEYIPYSVYLGVFCSFLRNKFYGQNANSIF